MYSDFKAISDYYDALYVNDSEYASEASRVKQLLSAHGLSASSDMLVLACGTGGHIPYFKDTYNVSGLDLSEDMLAHARRKFPQQTFYCDDMGSFVLDRKFAAMICMYGSIGFVKTVPGLRQAMQTIAAHLLPDGLVLITPWSSIEEFNDIVVVDAASKADFKIARLEQVRRKAPALVEVNFHHLIGKNTEVIYHQQSIDIGLFSREEYISAMTNAGLAVVEEYHGNDIRGGAYIGKLVSPK